MSPRLLTKHQYSNFVAAVAVLNNCRVVDIDFSRQIIDIEGPLTDIRVCCTELEAVLGCSSGGKEKCTV